MLMRKWVDNSKISCLERCPREFFLRYILHLTKESPSPAIAFGKALHTVIEESFKQPTVVAALEYSLENWRVELDREINELGQEINYDDYRVEPSTGELALRHLWSLDGACRELYDMTEEVIGTELDLDINIIGEWRFVGKADMVLSLKSGSRMLADIKSTGWKMESWGEKSIIDTQLHSYATALSKMEIDVYSGAYLVIQVNRRKLTSGSWSNKPTLKSAIFPISLTEEYKERMFERMRRAIIKLEGRYTMGLFECVWSSCQKLSGICQFHPLCERFWRMNGMNLKENWEEIKIVALSLGYKENEWKPLDTMI